MNFNSSSWYQFVTDNLGLSMVPLFCPSNVQTKMQKFLKFCLLYAPNSGLRCIQETKFLDFLRFFGAMLATNQCSRWKPEIVSSTLVPIIGVQVHYKKRKSHITFCLPLTWNISFMPWSLYMHSVLSPLSPGHGTFWTQKPRFWLSEPDSEMRIWNYE
jgi:hypothetical protein